MNEKQIQQALGMRRDYTIAEIADILQVNAAELMEAMQKHVEGDQPILEIPKAEEEVKAPAKKRGRKKKV